MPWLQSLLYTGQGIDEDALEVQSLRQLRPLRAMYARWELRVLDDRRFDLGSSFARPLGPQKVGLGAVFHVGPRLLRGLRYHGEDARESASGRPWNASGRALGVATYMGCEGAGGFREKVGVGRYRERGGADEGPRTARGPEQAAEVRWAQGIQ